MVDQLDRVSQTFVALADPTRRRIVERVSREPLTISALADPLAMSMQAVSKHIAILERCGVVKRHAKGRERIVAIQPESINAVAHWAQSQQRFWEDALDRLKHLLEAESASAHPASTPDASEGATNSPRNPKQKGTP